MAITPASLADGLIPGSKTTIYTSVAKTHVERATFVNTDTASAHTFNLYIKRSGSVSRNVIPLDVSIPAGNGYYWPESDNGAERLSASDVIEASADTANKICYTITGGTS